MRWAMYCADPQGAGLDIVHACCTSDAINARCGLNALLMGGEVVR